MYGRLDRLNPDFVFTKDEIGQVRSLGSQLSNVSVNLEGWKASVSPFEVVFSHLLETQSSLREKA